MADKDIDPVSGNHISPYMQDITGMFMLLAGKTDWMFRVSLSCNNGNAADGAERNPEAGQGRNRFRLHKVRSKPECSILPLL